MRPSRRLELAKEVTGQLLYEMRQRTGLRQAELAKVLGWPQSVISKVEAGERRMDFAEIDAMCRALGTHVVAFAKEFEERMNTERIVEADK